MSRDSQKFPEASESSSQAASFVQGLVEGGVCDFVISPGSRSTPLVLALRAFPEARARIILDERSAAFYALGVADRTGKPVALICTSGTAGANYYPAVVEAFERGVPLLLLTADRPPELRECGAGQTINQIDLFGKFVVWSVDATVSLGDKGSSQLYSIAHDGLRNATTTIRGPVHFNLPFREPFLPGVRQASATPFSAQSLPKESRHRNIDWGKIRQAGPGWILAGACNPSDPERWVDAIFRLSDFLGWPIFSDVSNPLRHSPGADERVITQYEGILGKEGWARNSELQPSALFQIGILPTAKTLRQALAQLEIPRWQCSPKPGGLDPSRLPFEWIAGGPEDWKEIPENFAKETYRGAWIALERQATEEVSQWMASIPGNFEGKIHFQVSHAVPKGSQVLIGNSMPARDAERYWFANRVRGTRIFANRGASGIDGMVSTAAGLADGGPPTFAILGDLTFLHDTGGLRAAAQVQGSLTLFVIDNGGGQIFSQLPIRGEEDVFRPFFLTPQSVDLVKLCEAHGIKCTQLDDTDNLSELCRGETLGTHIVIIRTDPDRDAILRAEWKGLFGKLQFPE